MSLRDGRVGGSAGKSAGFPIFFGDMDDHLNISNRYDVSVV